MTEINNALADDAQDIDIVMLVYNLIEYSDAYWKTSGSLWQYYRDEPPLDNNLNSKQQDKQEIVAQKTLR